MLRDVGSGRYHLSLRPLAGDRAEVVGCPCLEEALRASLLLAGACEPELPIEMVVRDGLLPVLWYHHGEVECTDDVHRELARIVLEFRAGDEHVPPAVAWLLELVPVASAVIDQRIIRRALETWRKGGTDGS